MIKNIRACILLESDGTTVRVSTPTEYMAGGSSEECLALVNNFFENAATILDKPAAPAPKTHRWGEE
jgi:hypothetical protein